MPGPFTTSGDSYVRQSDLPNVSTSYSDAQHAAALVNVLGTQDQIWRNGERGWVLSPYRRLVLDLWYGYGDPAALVAGLVSLVNQGSKTRDKVYADLNVVDGYGRYDRATDDPAGIGRGLSAVFSDAYHGRPQFDLQAAAAMLPGDLQIGYAAGPLPSVGAGAIGAVGAVRPGISAEGSTGEDINLSGGDEMEGILDNPYAPYVAGGLVLAILIGVYVWWVR
jgi:hypothetical protein